MRSFTVALVAGAGVLLASSAFAGPMTNGIFGSNSGAGIEQVRVVCDENGRCFERRGARRASSTATRTITSRDRGTTSGAATMTALE